MGLCCGTWASLAAQGLLTVVHRLLTAVASLVAEHGSVDSRVGAQSL